MHKPSPAAVSGLHIAVRSSGSRVRRLQWLQRAGSMALRLNCPVTCGIFPDPTGDQSVSPALAGGFPTTGQVHMASFLKSSVSYLLLTALHLFVWPLTKLGFSASAPWKEHWVGSSSLRFWFQTLQTQRQATASRGLGFFTCVSRDNTHCARNTAPLCSPSPWQTALID